MNVTGSMTIFSGKSAKSECTFQFLKELPVALTGASDVKKSGMDMFEASMPRCRVSAG